MEWGNKMNNHITRRKMIQSTGKTLAVCLAAQTAPSMNVLGANEKINLGFLACGGRNTDHLRQFLTFDDISVTAVCDVDQQRVGQAKDRVGGSCQAHNDFRKVLEQKDVDAVVIGTPDHWHCTMTVYACQAGKDVYVEKGLGQNIHEEIIAVNAVHKHNRIAQIGLQQRSGPHFIEAAEIIRSGKLGKVTSVHTFNQWGMYGMGHNGPDGLGIHEDSAPPEGVDYDFWLGPAPKRPFNKNRFHFTHYFNWDYSGGMTMSWGIHLFDIVLWVMGPDVNKVSVSGGKYFYPHNVDTPDTLEAVMDCPGYTMTYSMRQANGFPLHDEMDHGIYFFGTDGTLFINRNQYEYYTEKDHKNPKIVKAQGMDEQHKRKFLESIRSRKKTDSDIETGHLSGIPSHMANISFRTGSSIQWDNKNKTIIDNPEAAKLLSREPRAPWKIA